MRPNSGFCGRVLQTARKEKLWTRGDKILVGLSGGPDSVSLLHVLHELAEPEEFELGALHIDYGLRGKESQGDAEFCRRLCAALQVPYHPFSPASPARGNVQNWAREVRRQRFAECSEQHGYTRVAVGHTTDDRAETFLLQFFRGAGPPTLGALLPAAGAVIRPLADVSRADVRAYLAARRLPFRIDRSNYSDAYRRNRVRHELLPLLDDIFQTDAGASINQAASLLELDAARLEQEAETLWRQVEMTGDEITIATKHLGAYHPAVRLRVLRRMAEALGTSPSRDQTFRLLELLHSQSGKRVDFAADLQAERSRDAIWFFRQARAPHTVPLHIPGETRLPDGSRLQVVAAPADPPFPDGRRRARMALPNPQPDWTVRPARPGDRMRPFGLSGTRLVFDILAERGVPRHGREQSWVLTDGDEICWLLGVRLAERARVHRRDRFVYEFTWSADGIQGEATGQKTRN